MDIQENQKKNRKKKRDNKLNNDKYDYRDINK